MSGALTTARRLATSGLAAAALVVSAGAAAHAETDTIKDKPSDVVRYAGADDERGTLLSYADSVSSGVDLKSMRVKHTKRSVAVNLRFRNLAPTTTVYVALRLDGSSRPTRFLVNTEDRTGVIINTQGTTKCSVPLRTDVGTDGSINAVVKRSCLGNPKKIKASAFATQPGFFEDDAPFSLDVASATNVRGGSWTTWLRPS